MNKQPELSVRDFFAFGNAAAARTAALDPAAAPEGHEDAGQPPEAEAPPADGRLDA